VSKRLRGRPQGSTGKAAILSSAQIRDVFLSARRLGRYPDRAELVLALSIQLGLRATELASLQWADVYHSDGAVRQIILVNRAHTRKGKTRAIIVSPPKLRGLLADYRERQLSLRRQDEQIPLFRSQRGGHMTAASMTRFVTELYRKAGIADGSSRSGRRTLIASLPDIAKF
jgi:integrase/recombinase XerD